MIYMQHYTDGKKIFGLKEIPNMSDLDRADLDHPFIEIYEVGNKGLCGDTLGYCFDHLKGDDLDNFITKTFNLKKVSSPDTAAKKHGCYNLDTYDIQKLEDLWNSIYY